MTGKAFLNALANGHIDILQLLLEILAETGSEYCVIGGLAVNAYAEPVVSLDLDIVVAVADVKRLCKAAEARGLKVKRSEHSVNLTSARSDLRVQIQTDERYQDFLARSCPKEILGYRMKVAALKDVLQGNLWAYLDEQRRTSKRQKDLADIIRLANVVWTKWTQWTTWTAWTRWNRLSYRVPGFRSKVEGRMSTVLFGCGHRPSCSEYAGAVGGMAEQNAGVLREIGTAARVGCADRIGGS